MQFSSSPGFIHTATSSSLLSAHIAPSHTFARSCGMRPPGRLQTERPCIGGVHSCPRTCLPDTSRQFLFLTHHLLRDCRTSAFPQSSQKFKCSITWHRKPPSPRLAQVSASHWPASIWKLPLLEDNKTDLESRSRSGCTIGRAGKGREGEQKGVDFET